MSLAICVFDFFFRSFGSFAKHILNEIVQLLRQVLFVGPRFVR